MDHRHPAHALDDAGQGGGVLEQVDEGLRGAAHQAAEDGEADRPRQRRSPLQAGGEVPWPVERGPGMDRSRPDGEDAAAHVPAVGEHLGHPHRRHSHQGEEGRHPPPLGGERSHPLRQADG